MDPIAIVEARMARQWTNERFGVDDDIMPERPIGVYQATNRKYAYPTARDSAMPDYKNHDR